MMLSRPPWQGLLMLNGCHAFCSTNYGGESNHVIAWQGWQMGLLRLRMEKGSTLQGRPALQKHQAAQTALQTEAMVGQQTAC